MSTQTLNEEPYGLELASAVAAALEAGETILHAHREYCGMGLAFEDGQFVYAEVQDGRFPESLERAQAVFRTRPEFVTWLAAQSDESLSGRERQDPWYFNNQRINRQRLEDAVERARSSRRG